MHILFLTDNFAPEGNAPATRTFEHAREWVKQGHQVTVITGAPNFPEGKVYEGYRNRFFQQETMDGIIVRRVITYITANEGFIRRILDYVSFMISAFVSGLFVKKPDVIVATSPQFFCAVGGWMLAAVRCKPFIFELRDIWPASITAVGAMKPSLSIRLLEKLELFLYRRATRIVSVTHSFKRELAARGIDESKISVVINGVDLSTYQPMPRDAELSKAHGLEGKFVAAYIGTHGLAHALDSIVEAAEALKQRDDIRILFAGGGADARRIHGMIEAKGLDNVVFMGRQEKRMMPRIWSLCDVSIVHLRDSVVFRSVIPSKIFESFAMGLPILIAVPEGEATAIVCQAHAGLLVPPENAQALAAAITRMADDTALMQALRQHALEAAPCYDRAVLADHMLKVFADVI